MASLVDYQVLSDGSFELNGDLDIKFLEFSLPSDFTVGTFRAKPILMWRVKPLSSSVRYQIGVNDPQHLQSKSEGQRTYSNAANNPDGVWEAISGEKFNAGKSNSIYFMTVNSSSRIRVNDVILWYQRGSGS